MVAPCAYSLEVLDMRPAIICLNLTKCEEVWPCELREYWMSIHQFVDVTKAFLLYGTISICMLGISLNLLSIYVLISSGLAKNGSGIYLVALAVCDSGNLIFNYALGVARVELHWVNQYFLNSTWLCRFHGVFVDVFQLISAWIVVSFTVERCVAVWYPMILRHSRKHRSKIVICILCIVLSAFSSTKFFLVGFEKDSVFGYEPCPSERVRWAVIAYVRVGFQTWVPTLLVFVFNCLMFWKLRRIKVNRERLTGYVRPVFPRYPQRHKEQKDNLSRRVSKSSPTTPMLIAVSLAYLVLVFPLGVVQTVELYWHMKRKVPVSTIEPQRSQYIQWMMAKILLKYLRSFFFGFYQFNFTINFFLYCAAGIQFRTHLQSSLRTAWSHIQSVFCCKPQQLSTSTLRGNQNSRKF